MNRQHPQTRKRTDDEKLQVFMDSFHTMSQKPYWPSIRAQGRPDVAGTTDFAFDRETGRVAMKKSALDPVSVDLAGAYMRKLITGGDLVKVGNLLNILGKKFGPNPHLDAARSIWREAEDRKYLFYAEGDRITGMKLALPPDWTAGRPRHEGERREVWLSIADFAKPYFYTGFLHDQDDVQDDERRVLAYSVPQVYREFMAHLMIATSLYVSTIAHHIIHTGRPELCPDPCQEASIMAGFAAQRSEQ